LRLGAAVGNICCARLIAGCSVSFPLSSAQIFWGYAGEKDSHNSSPQQALETPSFWHQTGRARNVCVDRVRKRSRTVGMNGISRAVLKPAGVCVWPSRALLDVHASERSNDCFEHGRNCEPPTPLPDFRDCSLNDALGEIRPKYPASDGAPPACWRLSPTGSEPAHGVALTLRPDHGAQTALVEGVQRDAGALPRT